MTEPLVAQKGPFGVEIEAGKEYYWCACGRSANQPFCDGSHKDTGIEPVAFKEAEAKEVYLCGCKRTGDKPYCDGSHGKL
jgi:CDGSH-type Zn-finger protein